MQIHSARQKGGSPIVTLIMLAIIGYGVFVGIQYVPQFIESSSIQSILDDVQESHRIDPINSVNAAKDKVIKLLQVNELNDMTDKFSVSRAQGRFVITFNYERELNLLYETRMIHYGQSLRL